MSFFGALPLSTSSICSTNLSAASPVSVGIGFATYIYVYHLLYYYYLSPCRLEILFRIWRPFGRKGNTFFSISINSHIESCDLYTFLTIYGSIGLQNAPPYHYFRSLLRAPSIIIDDGHWSS